MPAASNAPARRDDSEALVELEQRYSLLNVVGEGTYGVVWRAVHKRTGKQVALKKIRLDNQELLEEIGVPSTAIREVILLRELDHPHIVDLIEVSHVALQLYLVFEFCHIDLKHFLKAHVRKQKEVAQQQQQAAVAAAGTGSAPNVLQPKVSLGLPKDVCKSLIHQLLSGLAYCHGRRILHRDLKPQNLLLDEAGSVLKIADFGLARTFTPPSKPKTQEVVTLWYRAPELLLGDKCYGASVDIWSVGCIMAELVGGRPLFPGDSEVDTLFKIFRILGTPNENTWPGVTSLSHFQSEFPKWSRAKAQSLRSLLPELDDAGIDLVCRLLHYVPGDRIMACEALNHPWLASVTAKTATSD
eukprot:Selendium_serpulae@DN2660_c0_g1_i1.p1